MTLDAIGFAFEVANAKLVGDLLSLRLSMQSQERFMVRGSLPSLHFQGMAFFTTLVADHFVWIDGYLPICIARIDFVGGVRRHPYSKRNNHETDSSHRESRLGWFA